jgi:hypothetical protein
MTKIDYGCAIERPARKSNINAAVKTVLKRVAFALLSLFVVLIVCGSVILLLQASKP